MRIGKTNKSRKQTLELAGRRFTRYLDYPGVQARLYFVADDGKAPKYYHVAKWEHANGSVVPVGWVIHHRDFNPLNNHLSNLELMTRGEHTSIHKRHEWNQKRWRKAKCAYCGKNFKTRGPLGKNCSRACAMKSKQEKRTCSVCGKEFIARKYYETKTCSIKCSHDSRLKTLV